MSSSAAAQTDGGNIRYESASGGIVVGTLDARVSSDRAGNSLTSQSSWGNVSIVSIGAAGISLASGVPVGVYANQLRIESTGSGIGTLTNKLTTEVIVLAAAAGNNGVFLSEKSSLIIDSINSVSTFVVQMDGTSVVGSTQTALSGIATTGTGDIYVVTAESLTVNRAVSATQQGKVTLQMSSAAGQLVLNANVNSGDGQIASGTIDPAGQNNNILINSINPGINKNGVSVTFVQDALNHITVSYDDNTKLLTIHTLSTSTANDVVAAVNAYGKFTAALSPASDNDGTGVIQQSGTISNVSEGGSDTSFARATITFAGGNNNISLLANYMGAVYNDLDVTLVNDAAAGSEVASYDSVSNVLTIHKSVNSTAAAIANSINLGVTAFTASMAPDNDGTGLVGTGTYVQVTTGGSGNDVLLISQGDLFQNTLSTVSSTGNKVDIQVQGSNLMSDGSLITSQGGSVTITTLTGNIALCQINANDGIVTIQSAGYISDSSNDESANIISSGLVTLRAVNGIGSAGAGDLDTNVNVLDAANSGLSGDIVINEVSPGGDISIQNLAQTNANGTGSIIIKTDSGNITLVGTGFWNCGVRNRCDCNYCQWCRKRYKSGCFH